LAGDGVLFTSLSGIVEGIPDDDVVIQYVKDRRRRLCDRDDG
jgi:hypothetical protein